MTEAIDVQVGSTITDGACAVRVTEQAGDSWIGIYISFGSGDLTGVTVQVDDPRLWHHVPFEWTELPGAKLEHRYVWSADWRRLEHEVRGIS